MSALPIMAYNNANTINTITFRLETPEIHDLLLKIGIPPHLRGYSYITSAIELILLDPNNMYCIYKGLYYDIAKMYGTTPSGVERSIRTAINVAWQYGDREFIDDMFHSCIKANKGVPTNSAFLARLFYYINDIKGR